MRTCKHPKLVPVSALCSDCASKIVFRTLPGSPLWAEARECPDYNAGHARILFYSQTKANLTRGGRVDWPTLHDAMAEYDRTHHPEYYANRYTDDGRWPNPPIDPESNTKASQCATQPKPEPQPDTQPSMTAILDAGNAPVRHVLPGGQISFF